MIVVDTNVIATMWVPNDMDEWVYKVLKKDDDWVAPLLWRSEFRNILSIYLRKEILEFSVVLRVTEEAEHLMEANEFDVNSTQVMSLVANSSCSAYDCEFVALADDLNIQLVTFDKKIAREFPEIAISPKEFAT
ncbi:type II toxin-antitoxin system VapC family toxin [Rhodohalobacter sulfatireducens]|uniref:Type II toxin-antitoxin system VapC family toxin n=1 Tax=Rhodohalobacter sulfatireducens TaxID=2911366 RepID=A0ABS9KD93_9BACT|nr:type II toxin-antitoxin system VapC family toxin [Rhodohalobacter sulfatireducens]MCG2588827.1 type II toxin-antitoxin system VapC family toxin [Rhodohalobacter sulfatireducens]MDR9364300.1 type II toxin-antitoxin system VapC family toxin [Balneolaceae bacterium]MDR9408228.1 type II toxin-antitoxin system VapC family toxin [Balneolaceae bacterium]